MGLDNIIYIKSKEVADDGNAIYEPMHNKELAEICNQLCGGSYTDDANSFRGKVYDKIVKDYSGLSLYDSDDWTKDDYAKVVAQMYVNSGYAQSNLYNEFGHKITIKEQKALRKLFEYILGKLNNNEPVLMGAWY